MFFKKFVLTISILAFTAPSFAGIPGYVTDSFGKLVRDAEKRCVKTGTWELKNLIPECDTTPVAPIQPGTTVKTLPVAPAIVETPLPEVTPTPAPIVLKKSETLSLSALVLFGFDKYKLSSTGEQVLDMIITELNKTEYKSISLDGYTDRFGTAKYNLKLSQKRADAVKAYLVAHGVDASKIKTTGHGKTKFRTTPTDCKGLKGAKLKVCYSDDRRVELTLE
jgi:OOP family OmpA-OmpF porin